MTGAERLLADLGVLVIRPLTELDKAMFEHTKATTRADCTRDGIRFGECRGCGTLVVQPHSVQCPQCRRALSIVEPEVKPAA